MHILYLFQRRTNYYLLCTVRTVPISYSYLANFNKDEKSGISKELLLSSMTMTKKGHLIPPRPPSHQPRRPTDPPSDPTESHQNRGTCRRQHHRTTAPSIAPAAASERHRRTRRRTRSSRRRRTRSRRRSAGGRGVSGRGRGSRRTRCRRKKEEDQEDECHKE